MRMYPMMSIDLISLSRRIFNPFAMYIVYSKICDGEPIMAVRVPRWRKRERFNLASLYNIMSLNLCHVGIHWIALAEYFQMSTHLPGFQSLFRFYVSYCIGQISHHQHKG